MWVGLSVLLFVCQLDLFVVKKSLSKLFFSNHIRTLIANLSVSVRILFGQVDDTAFYESKGSIWGHKTVLSKLCLFHLSFAYLERKNPGFFPKYNQQVCHNCLPRVQDCFLRKFFWKVSFFHHWALSDFCLLVWQKFVGPVVSTAFCLSIRRDCGEKI